MSDVDLFLAELMEPAYPVATVTEFDIGAAVEALDKALELEEATETGEPAEEVDYERISLDADNTEMEDWCLNKHNGYRCTRAKGHTGRHEGGIGHPHIACHWPNEEDAPDERPLSELTPGQIFKWGEKTRIEMGMTANKVKICTKVKQCPDGSAIVYLDYARGSKDKSYPVPVGATWVPANHDDKDEMPW